MESSKLYIEIDNIIRRNLYYAYNRNTAKTSFNILETYLDQNSVFDFKNFSITFPSLSASNCKLTRWRMPQTRIYLLKLSCLEYEICELQYFDTSIFLIRNFSKEKVLFELEAEKIVWQLPENNPLKDKMFINPEKETVLLSGKSVKSDGEIMNYLTGIVKEERQFHPINKIFSKDLDFLKSIDVNWAGLQWESKQTIKGHTEEKSSVNRAVAEMLSELAFYEVLESERLTENRFEANEIQAFWNILSLPAFTSKLIEIINTDTVKIIRFLISAYDNNFDWADMARRRIRTYIEEYLPILICLFDLVFILKSRFNTRDNLEVYSVSNYSNNLSVGTDVITTENRSIKIIKTNKETFTYAGFLALDIVSINKAAQISFNKKNSKVVIEPQIYQYNIPYTNICSIAIDSVHYDVVTAWKDFVLNLGKIRLKFLFKKDRYQVSIKGDKSIKDFKLNDSHLNFEKSRYIKTYYIPKAGQSTLDIYYTDKSGRQTADKSVLSSYVLNVIAINRYGQLIDNVHLRKKKSKKNLKLNPPGSYANVIQADNTYDLIVPKEKTISVEPGSTSLLTKFLYTESHLLQQECCIFIKDKSKVSSLREIFYNIFGIWLNCLPLSEINNSFGTKNLIISDNPPTEKYVTFQFHDEILLKQNGMKKAIFFTEGNFKRWIKTSQKALQEHGDLFDFQ